MSDYDYLLLCLARYVRDHRNPRAFAARLAQIHGQGLVDKLRAKLKEGQEDG